MKIGDLVQYGDSDEWWVGTIIEFPKATHAKEVQKVVVLTDTGVETWIMQYCEVVNVS